MRPTAMLSLAIGLALAGCRNTPPPRVPVPSESGGNPNITYRHDPVKPLPQQQDQSPAPPPQFTPPSPPKTPPPEPPQAPPPQPPAVPQSYLDAYDRVGRPRLLVLVDRPDQPARSLIPGDYELLERVVHESLAAGGQVALVPASMAYERISPQQLRDLQAGQLSALAQIGSMLRADVLVEIKSVAAPNDQTQLTATARNTRDGQQIATAASAIPTASPRRQIDFAGRLLGERMVDSLADAWDRLARQPATRPVSTQPVGHS